MDCIFCKIASGEIPSLKILETEHALCFLDIGPLAEGHLLIISKKHYEKLDQVPPSELAELVKIFPKLANALVRATKAEGYNLLQNNGACAGQAVGHLHFHLIPRVPGDGLGYRWNASEYPEGKDKKIQQKIISELES